MARPNTRRIAFAAALVAVVAAFLWRGVAENLRTRPYSDAELGELIHLARTFQDNLRVALEPAFKPIMLAYVRDKYGTARADIDIRSISVRDDGRFPVIAEVSGAMEGLYRQEKFLFWWDPEGWKMRYVEGDL